MIEDQEIKEIQKNKQVDGKVINKERNGQKTER